MLQKVYTSLVFFFKKSQNLGQLNPKLCNRPYGLCQIQCSLGDGQKFPWVKRIYFSLPQIKPQLTIWTSQIHINNIASRNPGVMLGRKVRKWKMPSQPNCTPTSKTDVLSPHLQPVFPPPFSTLHTTWLHIHLCAGWHYSRMQHWQVGASSISSHKYALWQRYSNWGFMIPPLCLKVLCTL